MSKFIRELLTIFDDILLGPCQIVRGSNKNYPSSSVKILKIFHCLVIIILGCHRVTVTLIALVPEEIDSSPNMQTNKECFVIDNRMKYICPNFIQFSLGYILYFGQELELDSFMKIAK